MKSNITPATDEFPELEWEQVGMVDEDIDEREETWHMSAWDKDGNWYVAIGIYVHGELGVIKDIELGESFLSDPFKNIKP